MARVQPCGSFKKRNIQPLSPTLKFEIYDYVNNTEVSRLSAQKFLVKKTFSSNVNEAIRAVLNLLLYLFLRKDFTRTQKHQKYKDATKQKHKTLQANKSKKCA